MPFATGTITGGDQSAGAILIQSQFGGGNQTIRVNNSTKVVKQVSISATDLKVGDQVQVQGVPTAITASSITAGEMPNFMPGGGGRPGFGPGGPGGGPGVGGAPGGGAQAFASATGKVTSINPLTISMGSDISLVLKLAANAKVTKIATISLNNLKEGDRIMASGQTGNDGTFTASSIGVNLEMGGFGGFGPGGPGGFGRGRGGPGGPGGPPGGDEPPPPPPAS